MPREVLRLSVKCVEEALQNGDASVSVASINKATQVFSESRVDELGSLYQYKYPYLNLVLRQFQGGKKEFDVEYLREISFKMAQLKENNSNLNGLDWATCGLDDPVAFGRALLDTGFLLIKSGRSDNAPGPARTKSL